MRTNKEWESCCASSPEGKDAIPKAFCCGGEKPISAKKREVYKTNNSSSGKIEIIDVTLRDGLQHEEKYIPTEAKLWIANALIDAGFRNIEIGSFAHPKYVPQFCDIEDLLLRLPQRDDCEYTVLALNAPACRRVVDALNKGAKIDRVLCGQLATSEAYARKNMNRTHEELFNEAEVNVKFLHEHGVRRVFANVATIFGCPLQGDIPIETAYEFVQRAFDIGFDEVEHSDTEGTATPDRVSEYFTTILAINPDTSMHSFHMHDIYGAGIACYCAAATVGISAFDCSIGGIGGQISNIIDGVPVKGCGKYYYANCRTGLVDTCDYVSLLNRSGLPTGVDERRCVEICHMLEKILGRTLDSFTSRLH